MANFLYIATDASGSSIAGTIEGNDRASVIATLSKQNLRPISIKEGGATVAGFNINNLFSAPTRVRGDVLVMFTRQLSAMIGAGVPLIRSLSSLSSHSESPSLKNVLTSVIKDVEGGSSFGDALQKHPKVFNDIYVNMVKAGETAGILDDILKRLAAQQEKNTTMRKKIKAAMTYPVVLMAITFIAFFGLMIFVIPQIGGVLVDLGGPGTKLPGLTLGMLAISHFLTQNWFIIIPVIIGIVVGVRHYIGTKDGRRNFHRFALKVPAVKTIVIKVAVARFARTFSALMGAGVNVLEALDVTSRALGNVIFEEALQDAAKQVKNGKSLSSIIEKNPLFPSIVSSMLAVGEETGQTDTVLVKVAEFYEEEVDVAIDSMSSIIEPVMIVIMGTMVGLIAASVMIPIASLSTSVK
jgi:type IV pilus assembly protein PilC